MKKYIRKMICMALAVIMIVSMTAMVFAEDTMTLTTSVPDATYTLTIPADMEIEFGSTYLEIEIPTVTEASGFAEGKDVKMTITTTPFAAPNVSTEIPFTVFGAFQSPRDQWPHAVWLHENNPLRYCGLASGAVNEKPFLGSDNSEEMKTLYIEMYSEDWGKALGGTYTGSITFSTEIVAS